jgi:hypothetical protein
MFSCRSFEDSNVYYNVTIDETCNYIKSYDCPHRVTICKHMFLVSRTHYIPFRNVKRGYQTVASSEQQQEEDSQVAMVMEENEQD